MEKHGRNQEIFEDILSGKSFKETAAKHAISSPNARRIFLRALMTGAPDLYEEGRNAGCSGAYATPALRWCIENKERIVYAILSSKKRKQDFEERVKSLVHALEEMGFDVIIQRRM